MAVILWFLAIILWFMVIISRFMAVILWFCRCYRVKRPLTPSTSIQASKQASTNSNFKILESN